MTDWSTLPYSIVVPIEDGDRDAGAQDEIEKWDEVGDFMAAASITLSSLEDQIAAIPTEAAPSPGAPTFFIASSTAPQVVKDRADLELLGTNDAGQINAAILALENQFTTRTGQANPQYGSITLSEGVFNLTVPLLVPSRGFHLRGTSLATILRCSSSPQSAFLATGAQNVSADKGLIMVKNTAVGQNSAKVIISDMFLDCELLGSGSEVSGIIASLDQVPSGTTTTYGLPAPITAAEQNWIIRNVHVRQCEYGIRIDDDDGGRDVWIQNCWVGGVAKAGIYSTGSDTVVTGCRVSQSSGTNAVGYDIRGANSKVIGCKATQIGFGTPVVAGTGFKAGARRITFADCTAHDCTNGFDVSSQDDPLLAGCRVTTQELGNGTGINLLGCNRANVAGCSVHTHEKVAATWGTFNIGINLPTTQYGNIHATIGSDGITTQVAKGGVAVVATVDLPTNITAQIVRDRAGALLSGTAAGGGGGGISAQSGNELNLGTDSLPYFSGKQMGTPTTAISLDGDTEIVGNYTVVNDGSATGGWPERLRFNYNNGTRTRRASYFNEYGEMRCIAANYNTVALRLYNKEYSADTPARDNTVPTFEVCDDRDNRTVLFSVLGDGKWTALSNGTVGGTLTVNGNITSTTGTVTGTNIGRKVSTGTVAPTSPATGDVWIDTN